MLEQIQYQFCAEIHQKIIMGEFAFEIDDDVVFVQDGDKGIQIVISRYLNARSSILISIQF